MCPGHVDHHIVSLTKGLGAYLTGKHVWLALLSHSGGGGGGRLLVMNGHVPVQFGWTRKWFLTVAAGVAGSSLGGTAAWATL